MRTGNDDPQNVQKYSRLGASLTIGKGTNPKTIATRLRELIEERKT
jgi:DNA-binding NarL/FixJ family response regulator